MVIWNDIYGLEKRWNTKKHKNDFFRGFKTPDNEKLPFDRKHFFVYFRQKTGAFQCYTINADQAIIEVHAWTKVRLPNWQRILDALAFEYEPLYNYDRTDEETNTKEEKTNEEYAGDTHQDTVSYDTNTEKQAGYDSGDLVIQLYDDQTGNGYLNQYDQYGRGSNDNENRERNLHSYGNIGVTSSQDLLKQEIEVAQISLYDMIIDEFKDQFCLLVY